MQRKCDIIHATPQLKEVISDLEVGSPDSAVLLKSKHYNAVACDLQDVKTLDSTLRQKLGLEDHAILFVAEVSITYMPSSAADAVIRWASTFNDSQVPEIYE